MKTKLFLMAMLCLAAAACSSHSETGSKNPGELTPPDASLSKQERNKKVIMSSMEGFMRGNLDETFKDAAPSFVDYADGSMPPITNQDSLKGLLRMITSSIEGYKGTNLVYYADDDHVLVHGDWGGVFRNDLMGIKATGKPVSFKDVDIFKLNDDGKIVEHHSVQDIGAILMAAGAR